MLVSEEVPQKHFNLSLLHRLHTSERGVKTNPSGFREKTFPHPHFTTHPFIPSSLDLVSVF